MSDVLNQFNRLSTKQKEDFLLFNGWKKSGVFRNIVTIWHNDKYPDDEIVLPIDRRIADYEAIVKRFILSISRIHRISENKVVDSVVHLLINVLRVRLAAEDTADGSIAYEGGLSLIKNAKEMLTSAALNSYKKRNYYVGSHPGVVDEYLKKVRLGQTEKGSFIVNVYAPVSPISEKRETLIEDTPFDHKVFYSLKKSLLTLENDTITEKYKQVRKSAEEYRENGISANLCDSIIEMAKLDERSEVCLTIIPSNYIDPHKAVTTVSFRPEQIPYISEVSESLKKEIFYEAYSAYGIVEKLQRDTDKQDGEIALSCVVDGKERLVNAHLNSNQYLVAIKAHREKLRVRLIGDLEIKMSRAKMISVDSFSIVDTEELPFE